MSGINKVYNSKLNEVIRYDLIAHRYFVNGLQKDEIRDSIIYALQEMQKNNAYYRIGESFRNKFVLTLLTERLKGTEYTCSDQQLSAISPTGKHSGAYDFVIMDGKGQEILIYEGLNLTSFSKTHIDKHIEMILNNYYLAKRRYSAFVIYLECDRDKFKSFIDKYGEHISVYAPEPFNCIGNPERISYEGEFLSCMKMRYGASDLDHTIYHFIVGMVY